MPETHDPEIEFAASESAACSGDWQIGGLEPSSDPELATEPCGHPSNKPPRCAVYLHALTDMLGHGATDPHREVGGVLLGHLLTTAAGELTQVLDIVPALLADTSVTHMTFTHAAWEQINAALDERDDALRMVGWYHTHPGFGPFYSAQDRFIHEHFFTDAGHIGLVLDPVGSELTCYGWRDGVLLRAEGITVWSPREESAELAPVVRALRYVPETKSSLGDRIRGYLRRR